MPKCAKEDCPLKDADRPDSDFYKSSLRSSGIGVWCKLCVGRYGKEYSKKNRSCIAERNKEYRKNNRERLNAAVSKFEMSNTEYWKDNDPYDNADKTCSVCKEVKSRTAENFYRNRTRPDGLQIMCRVCQKNYRFLREYGITVDEFNNILQLQNDKCAISNCKVFHTEEDPLHIDHCHITGKVRVLLCSEHNFLLGFVEKLKVDYTILSELLEIAKMHK